MAAIAALQLPDSFQLAFSNAHWLIQGLIFQRPMISIFPPPKSFSPPSLSRVSFPLTWLSVVPLAFSRFGHDRFSSSGIFRFSSVRFQTGLSLSASQSVFRFRPKLTNFLFSPKSPAKTGRRIVQKLGGCEVKWLMNWSNLSLPIYIYTYVNYPHFFVNRFFANERRIP